MLGKHFVKFLKIHQYAQSHLKANAHRLLPSLKKRLPSWETTEQDGKHTQF